MQRFSTCPQIVYSWGSATGLTRCCPISLISTLRPAESASGDGSGLKRCTIAPAPRVDALIKFQLCFRLLLLGSCGVRPMRIQTLSGKTRAKMLPTTKLNTQAQLSSQDVATNRKAQAQRIFRHKTAAETARLTASALIEGLPSSSALSFLGRGFLSASKVLGLALALLVRVARQKQALPLEALTAENQDLTVDGNHTSHSGEDPGSSR